MGERLVVVYTASSPGLGDIVKSALLAAGIPAETSREGAGAAYGFTFGPMGTVDILVPEEDVAEAEALLDAMTRGDLDDGGDDDDAIDPDEDL